MTLLDETEIITTLKKWNGLVDSIAIIGIFSSLKNDQELQVKKLVEQVLGKEVPVSLSSTIGSVGLIERENATILNAALYKVIQATSNGFEQALKQKGIHQAKTFLCQNDGTLMSLDYAKQIPILTIACSPTSSIRGTSYLAKLKTAVVLDFSGTTSDIGVLIDVFPRESSLAVEVVGVRTNFRMPNIVSTGVGGGSLVRETDDGRITIGPDSVGYRITEKALVFGGQQLTTTDLAVRLKHAEIGDPTLANHIDQEFAERAFQKIAEIVSEAIDKIKTNFTHVTLLLVGGESSIIPNTIFGVKDLIRNEYGGVANAIGASISQISGQYEQIYIYAKLDRKDCLKDAQQKATEQAILASAMKNTIELVEVEEIPLAYHPENATRLRVKVVGKMK